MLIIYNRVNYTIVNIMSTYLLFDLMMLQLHVKLWLCMGV